MSGIGQDRNDEIRKGMVGSPIPHPLHPHPGDDLAVDVETHG